MSSEPSARDFLRSTSMPTQPLIDDVAPSSSPLDTQLLELFFDRVPMGVAVFDTDMRLQRCNKTWTAFYEHYLGRSGGVHRARPPPHELIPGNEEAVQLLVDTALVRPGDPAGRAPDRDPRHRDVLGRGVRAAVR